MTLVEQRQRDSQFQRYIIVDVGGRRDAVTRADLYRGAPG